MYLSAVFDCFYKNRRSKERNVLEHSWEIVSRLFISITKDESVDIMPPKFSLNLNVEIQRRAFATQENAKRLLTGVNEFKVQKIFENLYLKSSYIQ